MTDQNFADISNFAHQYTGIVLGDHKRDMVYGRLARRIRTLGLTNFDQYCQAINSPDSPEISHFINAITTNLTSFFREQHHFDYLTETLLPELIKHKPNKRIRIWSAGCSTGEEPYSLAIVLHKALRGKDWDAKILATDLDSNVLKHAYEGVYDSQRIEGLPEEVKKQYFLRKEQEPDVVRVRPEIKALVTFKRLNLLEKWPMKGPFDVIFCRNVVIYFNKETQKALFNRYADMLVPGGHLFIGHSESLHRVCDRFELIGKTIYRKIN